MSFYCSGPLGSHVGQAESEKHSVKYLPGVVSNSRSINSSCVARHAVELSRRSLLVCGRFSGHILLQLTEEQLDGCQLPAVRAEEHDADAQQLDELLKHTRS